MTNPEKAEVCKELGSVNVLVADAGFTQKLQDFPEEFKTATTAEDHAYDEVGLFWQARPELPRPKVHEQTFAKLDYLSRQHQEFMAKKYDRPKQKGVLDVRGFVLR